MNKVKRRGGIHYAWWILVAVSIIVGLGKGALNNTAGLFIPAVTEDLGFSVGQFTLYFSVAALVTLVFLPIGGKIMAKYDARQVVIGAIILQAGGVALFGLMSHVWGWYLLAIPMSVGGTMITVIVGPVLINQWFKKHNGLALGILTAATGLVGAFAQPVVSYLIINFSWRFAYIAVGLFSMAVVIAIALILLRKSPEAIGTVPLGGEDDPELEAAAKAHEKVLAPGISIGVARKSMPLLMLAIFFFLLTMIASFSQHIPNHLENIGYEPEFSGTVMSLYMVGVLLNSLLLGWLADALGSRNAGLLTMVVGIVAIGTLLFAAESRVLIMVAAALFGVISAAIGVIAPAMTTDLFGGRDYSQVYAMASLGLAIASVVGLPLYGFIFDAAGSYRPVLLLILAMLAIGIAVVFVAFQGQKKLVEAGDWLPEEVVPVEGSAD